MGIPTTGLSSADVEKTLRWADGLPKREVDRFPRVVTPQASYSEPDHESDGFEGWRDRAYMAGLDG